jgi:hypothetical protein
MSKMMIPKIIDQFLQKPKKYSQKKLKLLVNKLVLAKQDLDLIMCMEMMLPLAKNARLIELLPVRFKPLRLS